MEDEPAEIHREFVGELARKGVKAEVLVVDD